MRRAAFLLSASALVLGVLALLGTATAQDTDPPVLAGHGDETHEATGPGGAPIAYEPPSAEDAVDGPVPVSCAPESGPVFPLGSTLVVCSASDAAGNRASTSFTIHVVDTTPPAIAPHPDLEGVASGIGGGPVHYTAPSALDLVDGSVATTCSPPSGSPFVIGVMVVACSATDAAGNVGTSSFNVTMRPGPVAEITIRGPSVVLAGYPWTFAVSAVDPWRNPVPLEKSSFEWIAPHAPGPYEVVHVVDGVEGRLWVECILPTVARIAVEAAFPVANLHHPLAFAAVAYDDGENPIPYAPIQWSTDLGAISASGVLLADAVGIARVTASSDGVEASIEIPVSDELQVSVALSDDEVTPLNGRVRGEVRVRFLDGSPVPGASVGVHLHSEEEAGQLVDERASGATDAKGVYRFVVHAFIAPPGAAYVLDANASWSGNTGDARAPVRSAPLLPLEPLQAAPALGKRFATSLK